ncbi:hypothetical protein Syncc8109_0449 [Synechococcus sp. WH 8109]|nr:hypothetical protein Syncc8109_0449 [Synechococcus sp. WH 8109]
MRNSHIIITLTFQNTNFFRQDINCSLLIQASMNIIEKTSHQ